MKLLIATITATVYGLSLRLCFGLLNGIMDIMSISFLVLAPMIIGFLTVIIFMRKKIMKPVVAYFLPWATSLVILVVTIMLNIEGSICWVMIFPFFAAISGLGGLIGYYFKKKYFKNKQNYDMNVLDDMENWDGPGTLKISVILLLPLILGPIEGNNSLIPEDIEVNQTIVIHASQQDVWKELTRNEVKKDKKELHLVNYLGFPNHVKTKLFSLKKGGKRISVYEKGLYFKETITDFKENEKLVLAIDVDPKKIPPTVMDEHILIGGKHIDINEDTYILKAISPEITELSLTTKFTIATPFNWYAGWWAKLLMNDIISGELNLIQSKASNN